MRHEGVCSEANLPRHFFPTYASPTSNGATCAYGATIRASQTVSRSLTLQELQASRSIKQSVLQKSSTRASTMPHCISYSTSEGEASHDYATTSLWRTKCKAKEPACYGPGRQPTRTSTHKQAQGRMQAIVIAASVLVALGSQILDKW